MLSWASSSPSTPLPNNGADATSEIQATAGETEEPAAEETEHHGNAGVRYCEAYEGDSLYTIVDLCLMYQSLTL